MTARCAVGCTTTSIFARTRNIFASFLRRAVAPFEFSFGMPLRTYTLPRVLDWYPQGPCHDVLQHLSPAFRKELSTLRRMAEHFDAYLRSNGHQSVSPLSEDVVNVYLDTVLFPAERLNVHKYKSIHQKRVAGKNKILEELRRLEQVQGSQEESQAPE